MKLSLNLCICTLLLVFTFFSTFFLQASDVEHFGLWLEQLQQHRFYRQNQINHGSAEDPASPIPHFSSPGSSLPRGMKPPTSLTGKNECFLFCRFINENCFFDKIICKFYRFIILMFDAITYKQKNF